MSRDDINDKACKIDKIGSDLYYSKIADNSK